MPGDPERASADRQAGWVALRTLRQRPTVVGQTDDGATIYNVRSVRLVLPPGSAHFSRLVQCAKCGSDVAGPPVVGPGDLDRPPNPQFCAMCARTAPRPAEPLPPPVPPPKPPAPADGGRLAAVEAQLANLMTRLDSPAAVDDRVLAMMDTQRQQLHDALSSALEGLRAEMAAVERRVHDQAAAVAGHLETLHLGVEQALGDVARRFELLTASADAGASRQQAFEEKVSHSVAEAYAAAQELARSHGELAQTVADLVARVDRASGGELAQGLEDVRAEVASLEQRMEEHSVAVAALVEDQRPELERALHSAIGEAVAALDEPLRELTTARAEAERRLEELTTSAEASASRLRALEEKVLRLLESPAVETAPPGEGRGQLLDSLERQLRAAEERIARR